MTLNICIYIYSGSVESEPRQELGPAQTLCQLAVVSSCCLSLIHLFLMPSTTTLAHIAITGCLYGDGFLALYAGESAEEEESLLAFEYGSESEVSVVSHCIDMGSCYILVSFQIVDHTNYATIETDYSGWSCRFEGASSNNNIFHRF